MTRDKTWTLQTVELPGPWAIYTYIDLTDEEEKAFARDNSMSRLIEQRYNRMAPVVAAIAEQTIHFFDKVLPARVEALVAERSGVLAGREAIVASLNLEEDWAKAPSAAQKVPRKPAAETVSVTDLDDESDSDLGADRGSRPNDDGGPAEFESETAPNPFAGAGLVTGTGLLADTGPPALGISDSESLAQPSTSDAAVRGAPVQIGGDLNIIFNNNASTSHSTSTLNVSGDLLNGGEPKKRQPHWGVLLLLPIVIGLVLTWLGLNEWRVPWVDKPKSEGTSSSAKDAEGDAPTRTSDSPSPADPSSEVTQTSSTAPVLVNVLPSGGLDVSWSIVDDPDLRGYDVYVTAVRPIEYEYGVPRYAGDTNVSTRIYPVRYLNKLLKEEGDPRKVKPGQVWHVCVQGMREVPLNEPIDDYIIPGTRACSDDFNLS